MAREPNISKYCVVRRPGAFAVFHVYTMLTPSMGRCATPLTITGCGRPTASRIVGTMSITW
jgi:hypothetical protein